MTVIRTKKLSTVAYEALAALAQAQIWVLPPEIGSTGNMLAKLCRRGYAEAQYFKTRSNDGQRIDMKRKYRIIPAGRERLRASP